MLHEASPERKAALTTAEALLGEMPNASVRVSKETYDAGSGAFQSVTIFQRGDESQPMAERDEDVEIPCFKPEDLYSLHARQTISRVLSGFLTRMRLTTMELLHRADALEKIGSQRYGPPGRRAESRARAS